MFQEMALVLDLEYKIQSVINDAKNENKLVGVTFFITNDNAQLCKFEHPFVVGPVDVNILSKIIDDDGNNIKIVHQSHNKCGIVLLDDKLKTVATIFDFTSRTKAIQSYIGSYFSTKTDAATADVAIEKEDETVFVNSLFEKDDPKTFMSLNKFLEILGKINEEWPINVSASSFKNLTIKFCPEDGIITRQSVKDGDSYSSLSNCLRLSTGYCKVGELWKALKIMRDTAEHDRNPAVCLDSKNIVSVVVKNKSTMVMTNDVSFKNTHFVRSFDARPFTDYINKLNDISVKFSPTQELLNSKVIATIIDSMTTELENHFHLQYYLTKDGRLYTLNQIISKYADNHDFLGDIPRLMMAHDLIISKTSCAPSKSVCVVVLDIKDGGTLQLHDFECAVEIAYAKSNFSVSAFY